MIILITPTGNRPQQIRLCAEFMKRQKYVGDITWIIIDDCRKQTVNFIDADFIPKWDIIKMRPDPLWQIGSNTQGRNHIVATSWIRKNFKKNEVKAILIIEDDDYYRPNYIKEMAKRIGKYDLIGEVKTIYYNLTVRRWYEHQNLKWSSLFQTGFSYNLINTFEQLSLFHQNGKVIVQENRLIDYKLFPIVNNKLLFETRDKLSIGMKGLPGRFGIGSGHEFIAHMHPDPEFKKLKKLLNDDYHYYDGYLCNI